jgi:DNA-binding SARP family transcriptional activator/streptogramin lyase
MRYLILGPLEVRDGETDVALRGGQQRKLLAILLLRSGEAVSSDRLIDELWDGKPPETAAKALQGYVSSLRKQLGPETVETVGAGYRMAVAPEDLDAHRFEELLAEARPLEHAPAAAKLREALGLWRGPALADFAYDDFARSEIERLDELRLVAVERRIDLELALGHHDDLVPELEALVRAHPLRERLRGHLMVALYRSGRQAEALDAYRDARTALRDELGLEPSEDLQALQRAILDHDPALAAPPRVDPPAQTGADGRPQGRRFRHPLVAVAFGLAILGGAIAAAVLTRSNGEGAPIVVPANKVARIDPVGMKIKSYQPVGRDPRAIAVGLGSVWVANGEDGTVDRLDPATGSFQGQSHPIGIGGDDLSGIAIGSHAVWVADGNAGTVTRIDPNLDLAQTIRPDPKQTVAPDPVFFIAYGSHYVWATRANELLRIDPQTNQVDKRLVIGTPTGLATGGGSVWVTTQAGLLRIDPVRVEESGRHPFGFARAPVYTRGSVWLIVDSEIHQIDPITLDQRDVEPAGSEPASLAAGGGALWAADFFDGKLTRLAAAGGRTASLRVGKNLKPDPNRPPSGASNLSAVAVGGGAVWVGVSVGH